MPRYRNRKGHGIFREGQRAVCTDLSLCVCVCVCVCVCRGYRGEEGLVWVGRWGPLLKGLMYLSTFNS